MSTRQKIVSLFLLHSVLVLPAGAWAAPAKNSAKSNFLKFALSEITKTESSMESASAEMKMASKFIMEQKVIKVFPDGAGLVSSRLLKVENGETLKELAPAKMPEGNAMQESFLLITADGSIYPVNQGMGMEGSGDLDALKGAKSASQWIRERSSMHTYKFPRKPLNVGEKADWSDPSNEETWTLTRQKDEAVNGTPCEVYDARTVRGSAPLVEILWYCRPKGKILKRVLRQEGDNRMESIDLVIK